MSLAPRVNASSVNAAMTGWRRSCARRPHVGRQIHAVAHRELRRPTREPADHLVVDLVVHEETRRRDADLSCIAELARHGGFDKALDVRIVHHDHRRVAAELKRDPLQHLSHQRTEMAADLCRTGEGPVQRSASASAGRRLPRNASSIDFFLSSSNATPESTIRPLAST